MYFESSEMATSRWKALRSFEPTALVRMLEEIRRFHVRIADVATLNDARVERLRRLLAKTNESELEALAATLERLDILAIADLLAQESDPSIADKAVRVGAATRSSALAIRAWSFLVRVSLSSHLVRLLRRSFETGLSSAVVEAEGDARVRSWLEEEDVALRLLSDLEERGQTIDEWLGGLPRLETPIEPSTRLYDELRRRLLTHGGRSTLERHHHHLLRWVKELAAGQATLREDFSANYLKAFREGKRWDEWAADWISEQFGEPQPSLLTGFWRRLDRSAPGLPAEVAAWLALRRVKEFFGKIKDPHGRFEFWGSNFADHLVHAELVAEGEGLLMHLPPLAVMEFARPPNAAYVYPESLLGALQSLRSPIVESYKMRDKLLLRPSTGEPFRIIHLEGWQGRYLNDLRIYLRRRRS